MLRLLAGKPLILKTKNIDMKTLKQFQQQVAHKHGLGDALVTGHKVVYFDEATMLYAEQERKKAFEAALIKFRDYDDYADKNPLL